MLAFIELFRLIKREKPNIVHLNSSKVGGLGALATRLCNTVHSLEFIVFSCKSLIWNSKLQTTNYKPSTKIVFTAHGWAFKERRSLTQKLIIQTLSWITTLLSHAVITVSHDDAERIRPFPFIGKKVRTIHNGIGNIDFLNKQIARATLIGNMKLPEDEEGGLWVGTVGELHKNKGFEYAIRAIGAITADNHKAVSVFSIIGKGEEREKLESIARKNAPNAKIVFTGEIKNAATLLKAFDIFILSSLKEGLPYALLEAGSAGIASIATDVGGIPEIIDDMDSGIVVRAGDAGELRDALNFLIAHPEKRVGFGKKLSAKIQNQFSLSKMVSETKKTYAK